MALNSNCCSDDMDEREAELERRHFNRIVNAFINYKVDAMNRVNKVRKYYNKMLDRHKKMVPGYAKQLEDVTICINHNQEVFKRVIQCTECMFMNVDTQTPEGHGEVATSLDMDKVRTVLRQIMRDWSHEGAHERASCYTPVIDYIQKFLPLSHPRSREVWVLVPGAGLGRLMFDLACLGYCCQGNEWSLIMLFVSNFILNHCKQPDCMTVYPWIHCWVNNGSYKHQVRSVTFPDVDPSSVPESADFSMAAGDFLEVYKQPDTWDAIATVYFIDTAQNIIDYVENIWRILKPGGYWVNHGPLLYHWTDIPDECSIDLSYDDVRSVILQTGFIFEVEKTDVQSTYTQNVASMLQYTYRGVLFVARKPL